MQHTRRSVLAMFTGAAFAPLAACEDKEKAAMQAYFNKQVRPGRENIGGPLTGLLHNDEPFTDNDTTHYRLVYFSTAHRINNCSADLGVLRNVMEELKSRCSEDTAGKIIPVIIYPDHIAELGAATNLTEQIYAPGSPFFALHGPLADVRRIAAGYAALYFPVDSNVINNHSRFVYLMGPDGKNRAFFFPETPVYFMADQIIATLREDGQIPKKSPKACRATLELQPE